ncbi:MAG: hypothetical protein ABRQ25_04180 [Clostridiaceae bacterium]
MNIIFCNTPWMKYYNGVNDNDKPKNSGKYIDEEDYGSECFNFQDYNGKCYGYVALQGEINLEEYFKDADKDTQFNKDVLVVWTAADDSNETRIVGWYKNSAVFRTVQTQEAFTNESFNLTYNITADSKDCYLLPEDQRTFSIQRAAEAGEVFAQTDLNSKVLQYIDSCKGKFDNEVFTDEILEAAVETDDFEKLYDEGMKFFEEGEYLAALKYFNTARGIKETPEVLFQIGECLSTLCCFNKAIPFYEKVIELQGNTSEVLKELLHCYDVSGNREKTIEYCKVLLNELGDSEEDLYEKKLMSIVMFNIYISLEDKENAKDAMNIFSGYCEDDEDRENINEMKRILEN